MSIQEMINNLDQNKDKVVIEAIEKLLKLNTSMKDKSDISVIKMVTKTIDFGQDALESYRFKLTNNGQKAKGAEAKPRFVLSRRYEAMIGQVSQLLTMLQNTESDSRVHFVQCSANSPIENDAVYLAQNISTLCNSAKSNLSEKIMKSDFDGIQENIELQKSFEKAAKENLKSLSETLKTLLANGHGSRTQQRRFQSDLALSKVNEIATQLIQGKKPSEIITALKITQEGYDSVKAEINKKVDEKYTELIDSSKDTIIASLLSGKKIAEICKEMNIKPDVFKNAGSEIIANAYEQNDALYEKAKTKILNSLLAGVSLQDALTKEKIGLFREVYRQPLQQEYLAKIDEKVKAAYTSGSHEQVEKLVNDNTFLNVKVIKDYAKSKGYAQTFRDNLLKNNLDYIKEEIAKGSKPGGVATTLRIEKKDLVDFMVENKITEPVKKVAETKEKVEAKKVNDSSKEESKKAS